MTEARANRVRVYTFAGDSTDQLNRAVNEWLEGLSDQVVLTEVRHAACASGSDLRYSVACVVRDGKE